GNLLLWEAGEAVEKFPAHRGPTLCVALTPDGRWAVTGGKDNLVRVWEPTDESCRRTLAGHTGPVRAVTVTPDRGLALSASEDNTVRVWDLAAGRCLAVYYAGAEVRSVSDLWPGGRFACGTVDGQSHALTLRNVAP